MPTKKPAAKKPAAKKPAAKKPAAKKPAASAARPAAHKRPAAAVKASAAAETTYSLAALGQKLGPATADEVAAFIDVPREALVAAGAQVATGRITTDAGRLYGQALTVLDRASPAQRRALAGLSRTLLRLSVFAAQHGQERADAVARAEAEARGRQQGRRGTTAEAETRAAGYRDVLLAALRTLSGGAPQRLREIQAAAEQPTVAAALTALCALGRRYLTDRDPKVRARVQDAALDSAFLDEIAAHAGRLAGLVAEGAAPRESVQVDRAEVSLWDGINLVFIERLLDLFDAAHRIEPTVPRLSPLALRGWFGKRAGGAKPAPTPPPAPDKPGGP